MNYDDWKSTDPADRDPYRDEPPPLSEIYERERDPDDPGPPPLISPAGGPVADPGPLTSDTDDPTSD